MLKVFAKNSEKNNLPWLITGKKHYFCKVV